MGFAIGIGDGTMYEMVADFIRELGFPIGVAIYLLTIFRKSISENTKAIMELTRYIKNSNDKNTKK